MPLGSEAADHEIVNGSVTEAESAGLSGRGVLGVASAGAIPTTSTTPHRTSNADSRVFNAPPPLGRTGMTRTMSYTRTISERFARVLCARPFSDSANERLRPPHLPVVPTGCDRCAPPASPSGAGWAQPRAAERPR